MQKHVISNKMILLTDDEWRYYQEICKSYDNPPSMKGESLFYELFESDSDGMITFIKPPSQRQTSLECWLFIAALFQHQQLRLMRKQVDDLCENIKTRSDAILNELKSDATKTLQNTVVADKPSTK